MNQRLCEHLKMLKLLCGVLMIGFFNFISCTDREECENRDIGIVSILPDDLLHLNMDFKDSLVFKDQNGAFHYYEWLGGSDNPEIREVNYECQEGGGRFSATYEVTNHVIYYQTTTGDTGIRFQLMRVPPLPNALIAGSEQTRDDLLTQFANQLEILINNNSGSNQKLLLFTTSESQDLPLEAINANINPNFAFYENITLGGIEFAEVYYNRQDDYPHSEIYYSKSKGVIQFTDQEQNLLTLDSIIIRARQ